MVLLYAQAYYSSLHEDVEWPISFYHNLLTGKLKVCLRINLKLSSRKTSYRPIATILEPNLGYPILQFVCLYLSLVSLQLRN